MDLPEIGVESTGVEEPGASVKARIDEWGSSAVIVEVQHNVAWVWGRESAVWAWRKRERVVW